MKHSNNNEIEYYTVYNAANQEVCGCFCERHAVETVAFFNRTKPGHFFKLTAFDGEVA